jgi:spermidine synthase
MFLGAITACVLVSLFLLGKAYSAYKNRHGNSLMEYIEAIAQKQAEWLDTTPQSWRGWSIAAMAAISLFLELAVIRWHGGMFPVFSFYKNFTLLACFAGLGAGYATAKRAEIPLIATLPVLFVMAVFLTTVRYGSGRADLLFLGVPTAEQSNQGLQSGVSNLTSSNLLLVVAHSVPLYFLLGFTFLLTALAFYPIGQVCGRLMENEARLKAYGYNLLGSVLGVVCMMICSYLWTPPSIWLIIAVTVILLFLAHDRQALSGGLIFSALFLVAVLWPVRPFMQQIFSPYQLIERSGKEDGRMVILSGGNYYQKVYDLSIANKNRDTEPALKSIAAYYEMPFMFKSSADHVAIVGAGCGNDVAAALRMGANRIDAIEIDPVILYLGRYYHPEKPYDNPRVNAIINDARTFFRRARPGYDLIVYGVLDSLTLLSHASNLRVDSYVYTKEGIEDAYRLLKEGGIISLSFALPVDEMGYKIYHIFADLPGASKPLAIRTGYDAASTTAFLVRKGGTLTLPPGLLARSGFTDISSHYAAVRPDVDIPTDDWPFFYMGKRVYPTSYVVALSIILALSVYLMHTLVGLERPKVGYLPFFFLGAGFMLVETKAITELGLYFGNTWIVVAVVIIGLLCMAYCANYTVARWRVTNTLFNYTCLFATLATGYYVASHGKMDASSPMSYSIVVLLLTSPMFFSGLIFSTLLDRSTISISPAMAYNLLGALVGGLLEYNSMYFGFAFLYLLAMTLYLGAWATTRPKAKL